MSKVLIIGGFGFIGSNLTLVLQEEYEVYILEKGKINIPQSLSKKIKVVNEVSDLKSIFFSVVINCAVDYGRESDMSNIVKTNILLPLELIEILRYDLFINFDSYFSKFSFTGYLEKYTHSKKCLSRFLEFYEKPILNLVLEHVFGFEKNMNKFVNKTVYEFTIKKNLMIFSEGTQRRDFIYIKDLVNLIEEIVMKRHLFEKRYYMMNIGLGKSITIKDFVKICKNVTQNKNSVVKFSGDLNRKNEIMNSFADLTTIPMFISWEPSYTVKEGVNEIWKRIKEE